MTKPILCYRDCNFEFTHVVEHCPKCGRFVGDFIRRTMSRDLVEANKNKPMIESIFHKGPTNYGINGW